MPTLNVRNLNEVPAPSRGSKAVREEQQRYEGFIQAINGDVGELELALDENVRSVKVRLRRAASRLGKDLDIWDADDNVYFRAAAAKRGRPRKAKG